MKTEPIYKIGKFGTHVVKNPAGTFSFAGNVPHRFRNDRFDTELDAINAFAEWFANWPETERRNGVVNLRIDVFAIVVGAIERNKQKIVIQPTELKGE